MLEVLDQYGYLALALGTFLEGETALLMASALIRDGIFAAHYTVLFGFAGSFVSDWIYYLIGRFNGTYFISRRPKLRARFAPIESFFARNQLQVLISYRFLYGFRIVIPLLVGMSGISVGQYLIFSITSGLLWASAVSLLGFGLGAVFKLTTQSFQDNILFILAALTCFGLLVGWTVNKVVARSNAKQN